MHVFEKSDLAAAPYRCTRYELMVKTHKTPEGNRERAVGSCDYCGTTIKHAYWIKGGCGREFKVGSHCVARVDPGLASEMKIMQREARKAARQARYEYRMAELSGLIDTFKAYAAERAPEFFDDIVRDGSFVLNWVSLTDFAANRMDEYPTENLNHDERGQLWRIKKEIIEIVKAHVIALDRAEKEAEKSRHQKHVGTVGAKIEVQARHIGSFSYETQWGTSWVRKFEDADGNLLVWFTGSSPKWFNKHFSGVLKATVKDHGHRDGEAQTIITRPSGKVA